MTRYIACRKTITTKDLANVFSDDIWRLYDFSKFIITDKDSIFIAKFWSIMCYHLQIKQKLSIAFHSQTNDQTERQNQTLKQYLRSYINYQQDN